MNVMSFSHNEVRAFAAASRGEDESGGAFPLPSLLRLNSACSSILGPALSLSVQSCCSLPLECVCRLLQVRGCEGAQEQCLCRERTRDVTQGACSVCAADMERAVSALKVGL